MQVRGTLYISIKRAYKVFIVSTLNYIIRIVYEFSKIAYFMCTLFWDTMTKCRDSVPQYECSYFALAIKTNANATQITLPLFNFVHLL